MKQLGFVDNMIVWIGHPTESITGNQSHWMGAKFIGFKIKTQTQLYCFVPEVDNMKLMLRYAPYNIMRNGASIVMLTSHTHADSQPGCFPWDPALYPRPRNVVAQVLRSLWTWQKLPVMNQLNFGFGGHLGCRQITYFLSEHEQYLSTKSWLR